MVLKTKAILIYDSGCLFCSGLAKRLKVWLGISIMPNHRCKIRGIQAQIKKDVHLVVSLHPVGGKMIYSGADACAKVLSFKYNFIWMVYQVRPIRFCFRCLYWILKKLRRYL